MKKQIIPFLLILMTLASCSAPQKVTNSWVNPGMSTAKKAEKVFIAVLSEDLSSKALIETELAKNLQTKGIETVTSTELFPPGMDKENVSHNQEMMQTIRNTGSEAILTIALLNVLTKERYEPGRPYSPVYDPFLFYGSFSRYYNYRYPIMHSPGYFTTDNTYFLETNLYDVASEKLLWTVQSSVFNPSSLGDFLNGYIKLMEKQMVKDKLVAPEQKGISIL